MAANRLSSRRDVRVTVVNPRPVFVPRLRLHQLVGGTHDAIVDYRDVLADGVSLLVDSVTAIDPYSRRVTRADGPDLDYDHLVYAAGSGAPEPQVRGAAEFAYPVATLESAQRLRSVLFDRAMSAPVTVVGGGPTGIETATELAEQGRSVTLVCGGVLGPYLHPRARRTARKYLTKLGVGLLEGPESKVAEVTKTSVRLAVGAGLPSEITIWAAGFGVPDLAARSGLRTDAAGRLLTDETLTSVDDDRIVAAGDSCAPSDLPLRMSAYVAGCLGAHAADTIAHRLDGTDPTPIDLAFQAMCISFGRRAGIFQLGHKDDTAMRLYFPGPAGRALEEFSCEASVKHLVTEAHKPGSHSWPKDGKHRPQVLRERRAAATTA
ncbi:NADH dehydrogenase FAD-containing subunit [Nocardia caishijiensis]|uniref:NADH dehydrogenase FAD-containing subunit n=1 Tax=Nocardia caishijiensis TaxID=184756 RepID=A0ABQ6YM57_9NOCA|nr:NADH dehydrogenase FAD-containing subunit [Nocardia caishijiensis]